VGFDRAGHHKLWKGKVSLQYMVGAKRLASADLRPAGRLEFIQIFLLFI